MVSLKSQWMISLNIYKKLGIGCEIKNEIEGQGQPSLKSIEIKTVLRCNFGPNLEMPASIGSESW